MRRRRCPDVSDAAKIQRHGLVCGATALIPARDFEETLANDLASYGEAWSKEFLGIKTPIGFFTPPVGLEPTIFGLEVQHLSH